MVHAAVSIWGQRTVVEIYSQRTVAETNMLVLEMIVASYFCNCDLGEGWRVHRVDSSVTVSAEFLCFNSNRRPSKSDFE